MTNSPRAPAYGLMCAVRRKTNCGYVLSGDDNGEITEFWRGADILSLSGHRNACVP